MAYIATSLDATGVFAWAAHHIARASKGRGLPLFLSYAAASAAITALTGNDTSILCLTPIIIYLSHATGSDPLVSLPLLVRFG
jgi:arsenical pump membrane protein